MKPVKKMAVTIHRRGDHEPLFIGGTDKAMATPAPADSPPCACKRENAVIALRPAWLETPLSRMLPRLALLALIASPGIAFWIYIARLIWRS